MKRAEVLKIIKETGVNNQDLQIILKEEINQKFEGVARKDVSYAVRFFIFKFRQKYSKHRRI